MSSPGSLMNKQLKLLNALFAWQRSLDIWKLVILRCINLLLKLGFAMFNQMAGSFLGRKDGRIFIKLRQGHQRHTKVLFVFLEFGIFPAGKILMDFKGWSFLWLKNSYFTFFIFIFWQGNDGFVRITLMFALTFNCTNV